MYFFCLFVNMLAYTLAAFRDYNDEDFASLEARRKSEQYVIRHHSKQPLNASSPIEASKLDKKVITNAVYYRGHYEDPGYCGYLHGRHGFIPKYAFRVAPKDKSYRNQYICRAHLWTYNKWIFDLVPGVITEGEHYCTIIYYNKRVEHIESYQVLCGNCYKFVPCVHHKNNYRYPQCTKQSEMAGWEYIYDVHYGAPVFICKKENYWIGPGFWAIGVVRNIGYEMVCQLTNQIDRWSFHILTKWIEASPPYGAAKIPEDKGLPLLSHQEP